jgi:hypothetical protein
MLSVSLYVVAAVILYWVYRRVRKRRVGPAAVGSFYDMLGHDQRGAIEMIVEEKAEERDPERATGPPADGE